MSRPELKGFKRIDLVDCFLWHVTEVSAKQITYYVRVKLKKKQKTKMPS